MEVGSVSSQLCLLPGLLEFDPAGLWFLICLPLGTIFSSLVVAPGNVVFVLEHGSVAQAGLEPRVGLRRYV